MKIKILSSARQDLVDGYKFYQKQAEGVGAYFLDSLYSDIESLLISAGAHPVYFGKYHRLLSRKFPFAIYYRITDQTVLIYAVLDCRRSPVWIRERMTKSDSK